MNDFLTRPSTLISDLEALDCFLKARLEEAKFSLSCAFDRFLNSLPREPKIASPTYWVYGLHAFNASKRGMTLAYWSEINPDITETFKTFFELQDRVVALKSKVKTRAEIPVSYETKDVEVGICKLCGGRYCMDKNGRLVAHGYKISEGWGRYLGYRQGSCTGVGMKPWEVSPETGVRAERDFRLFASSLKAQVETLKSRLETLEPKDKWNAEQKISNLDYHAQSLEKQADRLVKEIADWSPKSFTVEKRKV